MKVFFERWEPVRGWPHYEVSSLGRVRSIERTLLCNDGRTRTYRGKLVKGQTDKKIGYIRVMLYDRSSFIGRTVHTLVADAFLPRRAKGQEVRHLDGNPGNNRVKNLAWGTRSENSLDKRAHGTDWQLNKKKCPRGHLLKKPNLVPAKLKVGSRECLACSRARGYCQYHPLANFIETANQYYLGA